MFLLLLKGLEEAQTSRVETVLALDHFVLALAEARLCAKKTSKIIKSMTGGSIPFILREKSKSSKAKQDELLRRTSPLHLLRPHQRHPPRKLKSHPPARVRPRQRKEEKEYWEAFPALFPLPPFFPLWKRDNALSTKLPWR